MPPLDYVWVKTDIYEQTVWRKYWTSLYHSVIVLTGNDAGPRGDFQLMTISVYLVLGAFANANIFGELAVLIAILNAKTSNF